MRTKLLPAAAILVVGTLGHAAAGSAAGGGGGAAPYRVNVTKVVEGDGPSGPYAVSIDCFAGGGGGADFEFTLEDGQTETRSINYVGACTVTEVDDLGAESVVLDCVAVGDASCVDGQTGTVQFHAEPDADGEATITITNRFGSDTGPDDVAPPPPPPAAGADAVVTTPRFTG
jgi:hypothetical protein